MIGTITQVWTDMMTWITSSLGSVQNVFYADGNLTFIGTLSVISVAIAVSLLIVNIVRQFLRLRG